MRGIVVLLAVLSSATPVRAQNDASPRDLGDRVLDVFLRRCTECHGKDVAKPKGRFGYVEDLARVAKKYVTGNDPDESELWWFLSGEPELMPPEKDGGPLPTPELALIRWWIQAGAPAPTGAAAPSGDPPADPVAPTAETAEAPSSLGPFHVVVIHFPIALLTVAALAELLFFFLRGDGLRTAARLCLLLGATGAVAAALSGWGAAEDIGYSEDTVGTHRWLGVSVAAGALAALVLCRAREGWKLHVYRILLLVVAGLVGAAGHFGGLLVHGTSPFSF